MTKKAGKFGRNLLTKSKVYICKLIMTTQQQTPNTPNTQITQEYNEGSPFVPGWAQLVLFGKDIGVTLTKNVVYFGRLKNYQVKDPDNEEYRQIITEKKFDEELFKIVKNKPKKKAKNVQTCLFIHKLAKKSKVFVNGKILVTYFLIKILIIMHTIYINNN